MTLQLWSLQGAVILSKWPIVRVDEDRRLSTRCINWICTAKALGNDKMSVVVDIMSKPLRVAAMHFDFGQGTPDQGTLLNNYSTWLENFPEPRVLAGDTNMSVHDGVISATTRDRYRVFAPDQPTGFSGDWVMTRIRSGVDLIDGDITYDMDNNPSDHVLVYATVELALAPPPPPPPRDPVFCFDPVRRKIVPCEVF